MKIGYARISTTVQSLDLQIDALKKAGCNKIYFDEGSGSLVSRPGLDKAMEIVRSGDTLVVWRLDRLGRGLKDLIKWVNDLNEHDIQFESLTETMNTNTAAGKLIFHMFGALAEFEKNLLMERSRAGMEAARARGRVGGRPMKLDKKKRAMAVDMYNSGKHSLSEICDMVGVSKPTLYKYIRNSE